MIYLRVEKNCQTLWRAPLRHGEHFIGRDPACEIFLDHPAISRRHARLVCQNQRVQIIDLASSNGTFWRGKKIGEKDLAPGETIQIAEYFLILEERKQTRNRLAQMIKSPFNLLAIAICAIALAVYSFPARQRNFENRGENLIKTVEPATIMRKLPTAPKDSVWQQAGLQQSESAPPTVAPTAERTRKAPEDAVPARKQKKNRLSPQRAAEAERLYWRAYQIMAYGNKNAYGQALVLLKKIHQTAPDREFNFYIKAQEKINLIMQKLAGRENPKTSLPDSLTTEN